MKNIIKSAAITLVLFALAPFLVAALIHQLVVYGAPVGAVLVIGFLLAFMILFFLDVLDSFNHPEGKIYQNDEDTQ